MSRERKVYISLGSNLGNRLGNLRRALELLEGKGIRIIGLSSVYQTEPVGCGDQPSFLNLAAAAETKLDPLELLKACREAEEQLGRKKSPASAPRPIDIDILFYDDRSLDLAELTIPHPRLHLRNFVLVPLAEIAPDLIHPLAGKSVADLLAGSPDKGRVEKYCEAQNFYSRRAGEGPRG